MQTHWNNITLVLAQDGEAGRPAAPDSPTGETTAANPSDTAATTQADGSQTPVNPNNPNTTTPPQNPLGSIWIWLLIPLMLFVMLSMGGRKEKKKHAQMMASLAKGDKVQTTGGIRGTVLEIRDDEVVVKVDENANAKMRFARGAIATIVESKNAD